MPVRPLETSLYWALHGHPHPPPQKRQKSHLPKVSASLFCPIFVFISKTSPAFFFFMIFVVDLSELWLLCIL